MQYGIDSSSLVEGLSTTEWLAALADRCCEWLSRRVAWTHRFLLLALVLIAAAIIVACPDFRHLDPFAGSSWATAAMDWKIHHPFSKIPESLFAAAPPGESGIVEHLRKCSYRISLPLLAHLFGLNVKGAAVINLAASLLFIPVLLLHFKRIVADSVTLLLVSLSVACSFIGQWAMNDNGGFDGFALLLLGLAALSRNPFLICLLVLAGGFADERVIVAGPLLWLYQSEVRPVEFSWRFLWRMDHQRLATLLGIVLFLSLRPILGHHIGQSFDASGVGLTFIRSNILFLPLALLLAYKGSSLLAGIGFVSLFKRRAHFAAFLLVGCALPLITVSLLVYDLSRSLVYSFPALLICLRCLAETEDLRTLRRLALYAAAISVVTPTYYVLLRAYPLLPIFRLL